MVGKHARMFVGIICAMMVSVAGAGGAALAQTDQAPPNTSLTTETELTISDAFLDFWQRAGAESTLGNPITPELDENGRTVQYFDFARLEHWPDDTTGESVRLGNIGAELLSLQLTDANPQPRHFSHIPWRTAAHPAPTPNTPLGHAAQRLDRADAGADTPDRRFIAQSGHTVQHGFKTFWEATGATDFLGYPLTEAYSVNGVTYQFFERGQLRWSPEQSVQLVPIGRHLVERHAADSRSGTLDAASEQVEPVTEPTACDVSDVHQAPPAPAVDELRVTVTMLNLRTGPGTDCPMIERLNGGTVITLHGQPVTRDDYTWSWLSTPLGSGFAITSGMGPIPDLLSFTSNPNAERWIEIDLTNQYLIAWEGSVPVIETPVSTGRAGFQTPPGTYQVILKLDDEHMEGTVRGEYFNLPDVPWVMYFTAEGHAIHGTYWHNNFGTPMSHGCVNLPIAVAEQLYHWAPMGTRVEVRR